MYQPSSLRGFVLETLKSEYLGNRASNTAQHNITLVQRTLILYTYMIKSLVVSADVVDAL